LEPLQWIAGTYLHRLLPNSPAVDAGSPTNPGSSGDACATADQQGLSRPVDGNGDTLARCDIGAVERGLPAYLPVIIK
jgi:hypothetical protein